MLSQWARHLCAGLCLLLFVGGSSFAAVIMLGPTPGPPGTRSEAGEGLALYLGLVWPIILVAVWAAGSLALLVDRRGDESTTLLGYVALGGALGWAIAALTTGIGYALNRAADFPLRGLPAALAVLLFIALDASALYCLWSVVRGRRLL